MQILELLNREFEITIINMFKEILLKNWSLLKKKKSSQAKKITRSGVRDLPGQHSEAPSLLKIQKISQAWWQAPVILAFQEAEAGELLKPGRQSCSEPRSCPCPPAWATGQDFVLNK